MNKIYDLIIIGGGAAGLMGAIKASKSGLTIALIEKNAKLGRKILISGAGQCNITNTGEISDFLTKYGKNAKFLRNALYNFTPKELMSFYKDNGLNLYTRNDGKVFPESKKAGDVVSLLYDLCRKYHVDIFVNTNVETINYNNVFIVNEKYSSKNILITTGGITYPHTGSTGNGYKFAQNFGHSIIEARPALSPIFIENYQFKDISGISFKNIEVIISNKNNKKIATLKNDLLLTHRNLSGPVILNISRYARVGYYLQINFVGYGKSEVKDDLLLAQQENGRRSLKNYLKKYNLPTRFILKILNIINIDENIKLANINKKMRESLLKMLTEYRNKIYKVAPSGMTTTGGVNLKEINPKTMESKLQKGLYFAGEVVDIDGDTGGYSIQAASSMAVLAVENIIKTSS